MSVVLRPLRLACISAAVIAAVAVFYFLLSQEDNSGTPSARISEKTSAANGSVADHIESRNKELTAGPRAQQRVAGARQNARPKVAPADEFSAQQAITAVLQKSQAYEAANTRTVYEGVVNNCHVVALVIRKPSQEQFEDIYTSVDKYCGQATATDGAIRERLAGRLIDDFTDYPKPFRVVVAMFGLDKGCLVTESFVDNETEAQPLENGTFESGVGARFRSDDTWGSGTSWAQARYSHLLAIPARDSQ